MRKRKREAMISRHRVFLHLAGVTNSKSASSPLYLLRSSNVRGGCASPPPLHTKHAALSPARLPALTQRDIPCLVWCRQRDDKRLSACWKSFGLQCEVWGRAREKTGHEVSDAEHVSAESRVRGKGMSRFPMLGQAWSAVLLLLCGVVTDRVWGATGVSDGRTVPTRRKR